MAIRALQDQDEENNETDEDVQPSEGDSLPLKHALENQDEEVKMVFAVRTDLKMKTGKMCAQVAHAAVEAARIAEAEEPKLLQLWESHGCAKICLKVDGEAELLEIAGQCKGAGLVTSVIEDAGRTQVDPGTITVCAVGPGPAGYINRFTRHLKLL